MLSALSRARGPLALVAAVAAFSLAPASAQLEYGGAPYTATNALEIEVPTATMRDVDVDALLAEDELHSKGAFRFGDTIHVELGLENAGVWSELEDGSRVWRLRVHSPGAHSISFIFSRYQVPIGGELFVYNDERQTVRGAYTQENHNFNGQFAIQPIAGDAVTLEYYEPAFVDAPAEICIGSVIHDYKNIFGLVEKSAGGGRARACETDVNCPEGDNWRDQIDAVARVILGGSLCTGSLVNNTNRDGTQYFFCANHCGTMNNAIFQFNYQRSGCDTGSSPTNMTVQGSVQMASSSGYDFRLARITPTIPLSYNHKMAGWDRTDSAPPSTTAIHHPQGDPKKISFDYDAPGKSGSQWHIYQWDLGVTEPGSSGSPLYTNAGRFIGQLCCGAAACGYPYDDYYGRLASQWNLVSSYLDPGGTGETTINLYDPNGGTGNDPVAAFSATPLTGDTPLYVAFTDLSTGTGIHTWAWDFGDGGISALPNPGYTYTTPGTYDVSLTVTGTNGTDTQLETNYIVVTQTTYASATFYNGTGVNPAVFTSTSLPILGTQWTSYIDGGSLGAGGLTFIAIYSAPHGGIMLAIGELLFDPTSEWLFTSLATGGTGISNHSVTVPSDPALAGVNAYAQGFLNNVGGSGQLANAYHLVLGY